MFNEVDDICNDALKFVWSAFICNLNWFLLFQRHTGK
jgi:hypothetical protein